MTSAPKFQSFNWMRGVARDRRISIVHRHVLTNICLHRYKDGQCNPPYSQIADEIGVHRSTVIRAVDVAVRRGWLAQPTSRGRVPNNLVLTFPMPTVAPVRPLEAATEAATVAPVHSNGRTRATQRLLVHVASRGTSRASTRNGHNGQRERAVESDSASAVAARDSKRSPTKKTPAARPKPKPELGDSFREFWAIYPRRVAKEAAERAYAAAFEDGADAEVLIAGAKRYAAARAGEPERYTAYASTWLRGKRWQDEPPPSADGPVLDNATGEFVEVAKPRNRALTWDDCIAIVCGAAEDDEEVRHEHLH